MHPRIAARISFGSTPRVAARHRPAAAHRRPGAAYYLLTAGGIALSLGIIVATFSLLARITGGDRSSRRRPVR